MANLSITQLPTAQTLTGQELVPVVQNGTTVQTTTGAIANSPVLNQTFLTVGAQPGLANSRYVTVGAGLGTVDGGAAGPFSVNLVDAPLSLVTSGTGFQVKTNANTLANRSIAVGSGLGITNADGIAGDPLIAYSGLMSNIAALSGTGLVAVNGTSASPVTIAGTVDQTTVANGNGVGSPTIGLASDPVLPGTGSVTLPLGTTLQRPAGVNGKMRYNTDSNAYEAYQAGLWRQFSLAGGVTQVDTGTGLLGGPITGSGTISVDLTVVATASNAIALANKTIDASVNTISNIANASLTNSSVTYNGATVALGGSATITATATNPLTIGTGLLGTSYNGSAAVTVSIDSTVATLAGSQTLTNKAISGSTNTLTNIANASLTNSSVTYGTTVVALGASSATLGGLTSVAVTQDPTSALQLATKQYVDSIAALGIEYHDPVFVESPDAAGNLNATYNQPGGAGNGVGATLTNAGTQAALIIDGVLMTTGKRVLIHNQTNAAQNGVYTVTTVGTILTNWVLTRSTDTDTYAANSATALGQGDAFYVSAGDTGASNLYVMNTVGTITFGTTAITFALISAAFPYFAGTGLNLNPATTFNISNVGTAGTYGSASNVPVFVTNAQGQVSSATNTPIVIANTSVTGLGTMSTQAASAVVITGGSVNNTTVGAATASTGAFTTLSASSTATLNTFASSGITVTGGTINGTTIGATTATTGNFTTVTATTGIFGGTF